MHIAHRDNFGFLHVAATNLARHSGKNAHNLRRRHVPLGAAYTVAEAAAIVVLEHVRNVPALQPMP
jgi:hypothetical protein